MTSEKKKAFLRKKAIQLKKHKDGGKFKYRHVQKTTSTFLANEMK